MRDDLLPTSFDGRIARLIEETAEVLKCIGKLQRFGKEAIDPKTNIKYDNLKDLKEELQDLKHAVAEVEKFL